MGQAKNRGTYEQRVKQAIEIKNKKIEDGILKKLSSNASSSNSRKAKLLLTFAMAMTGIKYD